MYGVDLWNYLKFLVCLDVRIFEKTNGIPKVEEVRCRLVELHKISSVVGCKNLQEGGRYSDG